MPRTANSESRDFRRRASRRRYRDLLARALLSAVPFVAAGADLTAQAGSFDDRVDVVEVQVPVYVTARGEPVRGLTRDSFAVFAGRRELPIVGFEAIDPGAAEGDAPVVVPIAACRHFLFLFDLMHSQPAGLLLARRAALDLVREGMHASDLAGVATHGPRGVEVLLGFTSDREQLALALASLGAPQLVEKHRDPLFLSLGVPTISLGDFMTTEVGGPMSEARATREAIVLAHLREMATV